MIQEIKKDIVDRLGLISGLSEINLNVRYRSSKPYRNHREISNLGLMINIERLDKLKEIPIDKIRDAFSDNPLIENVNFEYIDFPQKSCKIIDFTFSSVKFVELVLSEIFDKQEKYGSSNLLANENIILEYSSPNIAKPFHSGNLRSTIIGNFLNNLYCNFGAKTTSINYLGNWGKQYGKLLLGYEKYGNDIELEKNPIKHISEVYESINKDAKENEEINNLSREVFYYLESGDVNLMNKWRLFQDRSIKEYTRIYSRLGVKFNVYSGEKEQESKCSYVLDMLDQRDIITSDGKRKFIDLTSYNLGKPLLTKKDGTYLYLTRDIAAAIDRFVRYRFTKMLYIVASPQTYYFQQLFKILEISGYNWVSKCQHINFGMVEGMSTRKDNVLLIEDILDEAKHKIKQKMLEDSNGKFKDIIDPENTAEKIAVASIIIQDLSTRRIKDYRFDWKRVVQLEGKSGVYLQYTYARLSSLERINNIIISPNISPEVLKENHIHSLIFLMSKYEEILFQCLNTLEPSILVNYLVELSQAISACLAKFYVKCQSDSVAKSRSLMYYCAKIVLGNGLRLLGITPVDQM